MSNARLILIITAALLLAGVANGPGEPHMAEAAFPGSNGRIAFGTLDSRIATIEPDGSDLQVLTDSVRTTSVKPKWSPDGQRLVFHRIVEQANDNWDVFVINADGSGLTNLTNSPEREFVPAWSPDGEQIVFMKDAPPDLQELWLMDADGGNQRRLTAPADFNAFGSPAWSPDGTTILSEISGDIYAVDAVSGSLQNITNTPDPSQELQPQWSPDGQRIAFSIINVQILIMNRDGSGRHPVVSSGAPNSPAWSPDGAKLVFYDSGLWTTNSDGSGTPSRIPNAEIGLGPDWQAIPNLVAGVEFTQGIQELQSIGALQESTGGSSARYGSAAFPGANGKIVFADLGQIKTIEPDGTGLALLGPGFEPAWSEDGRRLAFSRAGDIFVMNADGSGQTNITNMPGDDKQPAWSPDGTEIAFASFRGGSYQIWVANADGQNPRQLTSSLLSAFSPRWSPDGSKILFAGDEEFHPDPNTTWHRFDLYTVPSSGGPVTNLTNTIAESVEGSIEAQPDWSPDGARIVFVANSNAPPFDDEIWAMNADGSGRHIITANSERDWFPVWSPDGQKIAHSRQTQSGTWQLYTMNADGTGDTLLSPTGDDSDWQPSAGMLVEFTQGIQELQSLAALQADLAGDGMPPVPVVAGKPAAMRVYMSEVDATTVYEVEATGDVNGSRFVQLDPGCTPVQRRNNEGFCKSVDFMFTPPPGDWDVTLKVRRQQDSQVLEEHEFNLTSAETVPLIIEPVTVCDDIVNQSTGIWGCGSLFNFTQNLEFLRATFPGEVLVAGSGSTVYADTDEIPSEGDWWDVIGGNVRALWTADGGFDNLYHFGVVRPEADAGTPGGIAYTLANAAAGKTSVSRDDVDGGLPEETADELVAHLLGLNMGLMHAPSTSGCYGTPSAIDPSWPSGSPLIDEVGYDVANEEPVPDTDADWMSLCTPRWISPYTANNVIDLFRTGQPRSLSGAGTAVGDFWLVGGTIDEEAGETEFDPLFELETEGPTAQGDGLNTIEVRDAGDAVLATRFFKVDRTIREDTGDQPVQDPDIVRFSELVPVQANAAKIVVLAGTTEVGEIELGGTTPTVTLTSGFSRAGAPPLPVFSWEIEDGDSAAHTYWVEFSNNRGETWRTIAPRYTGTSLTIDNSVTGGGVDLRIRVRASDGANTGVAISEPFDMQLRPPTGAIASPASGVSIAEGNLAWLQAMVVDPEDGVLDGSAIEWTSSRDGDLGTGASLHVYDLSQGTHTISMLATDEDGFETADSISVTVTSGGVFEGEPLALSGDVNCNGSVDSVDGLGVSRFVAGLIVSQTQPCPQVGTGAPFGHGDVNCSGEVDAIDALFILRSVAGLPVNLPDGCREIGT